MQWCRDDSFEAFTRLKQKRRQRNFSWQAIDITRLGSRDIHHRHCSLALLRCLWSGCVSNTKGPFSALVCHFDPQTMEAVSKRKQKAMSSSQWKNWWREEFLFQKKLFLLAWLGFCLMNGPLKSSFSLTFTRQQGVRENGRDQKLLSNCNRTVNCCICQQ